MTDGMLQGKAVIELTAAPEPRERSDEASDLTPAADRSSDAPRRSRAA